MPEFILDEEMALTYAALSASAARHRLFAMKAKAGGKPQTALLLGAMAEGEEIMARRALIALRGKVSDLEDYFAEAADTQRRGAARCARRADKARERGQEGGADAYERFAAVLRNHGEQFSDRGAAEEGDLHVCQVCGYVAAGEIPERCPVCNAVAKKFKTHEP